MAINTGSHDTLSIMQSHAKGVTDFANRDRSLSGACRRVQTILVIGYVKRPALLKRKTVSNIKYILSSNLLSTAKQGQLIATKSLK